MKMTVIQAMSALNIFSGEKLTVRALKRYYKQAIFKVHPDYGGSKEETQKLNAAYAILLKTVKHDNKFPEKQNKSDSGADYVEPDWFHKKNDGHPLHSCKLASVHSLDTLIAKTFAVATEPVTLEQVWSPGRNVKDSNSIYEQRGDSAFKISAYYGDWDTFYVTNVTEAGKARKQCNQMTFHVSHYSSEYSEVTRGIPNVIRAWLLDTHAKNGKIDCIELYTYMLGLLHHAWTCGGKVHVGKAVVETTDVNETFVNASVKVGGNVIKISLKSLAAHHIITPFNLETFKPLTQLPSRWTVKHFVRLLVNGQFFKIKQDYYHTDDYTMDAATRFREGYIDNPLAVAFEWIGDNLSRGAYIYESTKGESLNFGFHINDSSSLCVDLNNRYSLFDLNEDITQMEMQRQLTA
ncbi:TPA: hypothetical protein I7682_17875 [Vibrio vulnificus]|nr:hypothetical protein [Vibrio vulnificus]